MEPGEAVQRRDVAALVVARPGSVRATGDPALPWVVADETGEPIGAVSSFLPDFLACGNSAASCRSYDHDLLRWFGFLSAVGVPWDRARRADVRDFGPWLRVARNPARDRRRPGAPVPGEVNARTGKAYLQAEYAPATVNHALSVPAEFYRYHSGTGGGARPPAPPPGQAVGIHQVTADSLDSGCQPRGPRVAGDRPHLGARGGQPGHHLAPNRSGRSGSHAPCAAIEGPSVSLPLTKVHRLWFSVASRSISAVVSALTGGRPVWLG